MQLRAQRLSLGQFRVIIYLTDHTGGSYLEGSFLRKVQESGANQPQHRFVSSTGGTSTSRNVGLSLPLHFLSFSPSCFALASDLM